MSATISPAEMAGATRLTLGPAMPNSIGWDAQATYLDNRPDALSRDAFVVKLHEGGTYNLFSESWFDPTSLRIQSSDGTLLASDADSPSVPYGVDAILDFVAPYTGDYYVSASWNQGPANRDVSLAIFADLDTADIPTGFGAVNRSDDDLLVDRAFYLTTSPDVRAANLDPAAHYRDYGWREGRDPNPWFSTQDYLDANPDVKAAGINPLDHYRNFGWREGRDPSLNFDVERYLAANPDVRDAGVEPLGHWLDFGRVEGRTFGDVAVGLVNGIGFDRQYYLMTNADVAAAGLDPLAHYADYGWQEGRDPSPSFDTQSYLAAYDDVRAAGVNPLLHYLQSGYAEGRSAFADGNWA